MPLFNSSRPGIRLRVLPKFPVQVQAENGFQVSKASGIYTFGPDYGSLTELPSISASATATIFVPTYNSSGTPTYARASIDTIGDAIVAGFTPAVLGTRTKLSASIVVYQSPTGSDSNTGLSPASPFLTFDKCWSFMRDTLDLAGNSITVLCAAGTSTDGFQADGNLTGQKEFSHVIFRGDTATPSNVVRRPVSNNAFGAIGGARYSIEGFTLDMTDNSGADMITVGAQSEIGIGNGIVFGYNGQAFYDVQATVGSYVDFYGSNLVINKPRVQTSGSWANGATSFAVTNSTSIRIGDGIFSNTAGLPELANVTNIVGNTVTFAGGSATAASGGTVAVDFQGGGASWVQLDPGAFVFSNANDSFGSFFCTVIGHPRYGSGFFSGDNARIYMGGLGFIQDQAFAKTSASWGVGSTTISGVDSASLTVGMNVFSSAWPWGTTIATIGGSISVAGGSATSAGSNTTVVFGTKATGLGPPFALHNRADLASATDLNNGVGADLTWAPGATVRVTASTTAGSYKFTVAAADAVKLGNFFTAFPAYRGLCVSGPNIPAGTSIPQSTSVSGTVVTMSRPATTTSASAVYTVGGFAWTDARYLGTYIEPDVMIGATGVLPVPQGGTGATSLTSNGLLYGNGTGTVQAINAAGAGTVFAGTAGAPAATVTPTLGLVGNGGSLGFLGSTSGQITVQPQAAAGTYNFNLPTSAGAAGSVLASGGGGATAMTWRALAAPTVTILTSGSGTFTPSTTASALFVRMIGAGGGGGGSGSASAVAGGAGGSSTFGTAFLIATGGSGGAATTGIGGAGGTASGGDLNYDGGAGGAGMALNVAGESGGRGSPSPFSGGGREGGVNNNTGSAASGNSGAGGGGAAGGVSFPSGAGGGAGAYIEKLITSISASYSYAVGVAGTSGTAGSGGFAGGTGGSGVIIIKQYFQ